MSTALASATSTTSLRDAFPASMREVMRNYASAASLLVIGFAFYTALFLWVPYYTNRILTPPGFFAIEVVMIAYLVLLPLFYATFPDDYTVKCRLFWRAIANLRRKWPEPKEAVAIRAVAVKAFFMPLMVAWLFGGLIALYHGLTHPGTLGFYEMMMCLIVIIDLAFFTVAYGVEHPKLGNEIRSVEPTFLGWASALVCYPPFQLASVAVLGWFPLEHPDYADLGVQLPAGLLMLGLMGIYTWASVALGLKASNLTNRGTVSRGPYAVIRHPAYICKNSFWWVAAMPVVIRCIQAGEWGTVCLVFLSLSIWTGIYTVRALTEERHLMADPDYRAYCERVKWRYLPGVW
jgi:protein-S-isoprenylcysteine O-methyltransferase Ste14